MGGQQTLELRSGPAVASPEEAVAVVQRPLFSSLQSAVLESLIVNAPALTLRGRRSSAPCRPLPQKASPRPRVTPAAKLSRRLRLRQPRQVVGPLRPGRPIGRIALPAARLYTGVARKRLGPRPL